MVKTYLIQLICIVWMVERIVYRGSTFKLGNFIGHMFYTEVEKRCSEVKCMFKN